MNHIASYAGRRTFGDGSLADTPTPTSARSVERISLFGEVQAPLVPARWLPSWVHEIKTELAARYVAAATAQESNLAPTGGLKIDLVGGFSLRATVATSNRLPAPVLSRATAAAVAPGSGSGEVTYVRVTDPLRGNELNETVTASELVNNALRPESAVTRTVGLVYQRGQIHRFRASLDLADTRKSGELQFLNEQGIVNLESLFPGRVSRAAPAAGESIGKIRSVLTGTFNLAYRQSQNWTTALDYAWTECLGGRLDVYGRWLMFRRYDLQILPGGPTVDELGSPDGVTAGLLRHRVNFGAGWSTRYYGFGWDGHFFIRACCPPTNGRPKAPKPCPRSGNTMPTCRATLPAGSRVAAPATAYGPNCGSIISSGPSPPATPPIPPASEFSPTETGAVGCTRSRSQRRFEHIAISSAVRNIG